METSPADRIAHRREQLATYRVAYAECYGVRLDPAAHEARDEVLSTLLEDGQG